MFLYSFSSQFYLPSESATLPNIIPKEQLAEANGMFLLTKEIGLLIGYGSAGFLSLFFGVHPTLILCSLLLFIAFISVTTLPNFKTERKVDLEQDLSHFFGKVVEGYMYIKNHRHTLYPILLIAGGEIALVIVGVNIPALAKEILRIRIEDAALYIVIPGLGGAVATVALVSNLLKRGVRKINIIRTSLMVITLCFFAIGAVVIELPLSTRFIVLPIICFFAGMGYIGVEVPSQTFMQESTPQEFMGRIWGNLWFLMTLATIIPMIFSASITEFLGANTLFIILAIGVFFVYLFTSKKDILRLPDSEQSKKG
jgi:MFS family permease